MFHAGVERALDPVVAFAKKELTERIEANTEFCVLEIAGKIVECVPEMRADQVEQVSVCCHVVLRSSV